MHLWVDSICDADIRYSIIRPDFELNDVLPLYLTWMICGFSILVRISSSRGKNLSKKSCGAFSLSKILQARRIFLEFILSMYSAKWTVAYEP